MRFINILLPDLLLCPYANVLVWCWFAGNITVRVLQLILTLFQKMTYATLGNCLRYSQCGQISQFCEGTSVPLETEHEL